MTIRDLPEQTCDELAARAARAGQSLQGYVRARLVELAARPSPGDLWDRVQHRVSVTGTRLPSAEILDLLGRDRT